MQDEQRTASFARDGALRCLALAGLAVMIGGCADPVLAPASPDAAMVAQTQTLTHPAGVVSGTTPLDGEPYGLSPSGDAIFLRMPSLLKRMCPKRPTAGQARLAAPGAPHRCRNRRDTCR